jgi:hypothetical protein
LGEQAAADLEDALQDGHELIRQEVPETEYSWDGNVPKITGPDATLEFHMNAQFRSAIEGDHVIGFGAVVGGNRRGARGVLLGNLLYEEVEPGRYGWNVYRFRKQGTVTDYPFGPSDREHGLSIGQFGAQRQYMRGNVTHVLSSERFRSPPMPWRTSTRKQWTCLRERNDNP